MTKPANTYQAGAGRGSAVVETAQREGGQWSNDVTQQCLLSIYMYNQTRQAYNETSVNGHTIKSQVK